MCKGCGKTYNRNKPASKPASKSQVGGVTTPPSPTPPQTVDVSGRYNITVPVVKTK